MARIIDSHCHIFPRDFPQRRDELAGRDATFSALFSNPKSRMASAEALIEAMDRDGIDVSVVMGLGWNDLAIARESNDYLMESVAAHAGRLVGLCSVNPRWGQEALVEAQRCAAGGLSGIGELHSDTQEFDLAGKDILAPLMDLARDLSWPVLVHCSEPVGHRYPGKGQVTPALVYRFLENFPGNRVICTHWGGGLPFYSLMPEVPAVLENAYFDTAATPFLYRSEVYRLGVSLAGPGKVLFATDFPLVQPSRALAQVTESVLGQGERQAILGDNAARLFGL